MARIALVGYTNAGKSTLMNTLLERFGGDGAQEKKVLEKDMLFATLDTSVRKIEAPGHTPFLLSDTVGFISDLPHSLVKAFRSTLEEVCQAEAEPVGIGLLLAQHGKKKLFILVVLIEMNDDVVALRIGIEQFHFGMDGGVGREA